MSEPYTYSQHRDDLHAQWEEYRRLRRDAMSVTYAEGRRDERAKWLPVLDALQPFVRTSSSEDFVTITVRSADVEKARAAIAKATGAA